ncbi:Ral GTPase-activating protein subunit alpha-2, partial [Cichlidogyrus casuarinus]
TETHKLAVIYIGSGQEDKQSILLNSQGSAEFENFVHGLGWSVDLAKHQGFMGGLDARINGASTPYYSNSTTEVIFHTSTCMPSDCDDAVNRKFKHLGNDEVMIIWSEHWRPFRRSMLRTEFGDVLIVIYPLRNGLFNVKVQKQSNVPFFGPLNESSLVTAELLPLLVRQTAINASRAVRSIRLDVREHFEERADLLQRIISSNLLENKSFSDFMNRIFNPSTKREYDSSTASLAGFSHLPSELSALFASNNSAKVPVEEAAQRNTVPNLPNTK